MGAAEPRAPRHAVALAGVDTAAEVLFLDASPMGAGRRSVKAITGAPNITWWTHHFPTRSVMPFKLAGHKVVQRLARVAFRLGAEPKAAALSTRAIGLARVLEEADADVYVAHGIETLLPAWHAASRVGALVVFDSMEFHSDVGDSQSPTEQALVRAIERRILPECALVCASSDQLAAALVEEYGIRLPLALYNCPPIAVDVEVVPHVGFALYWRNAVLGLGQRGLDDALTALAQVPAEVSLHLQGSLPSDGGARLRARIDELGLNSRVIIHPPHLPEEAVRAAAPYSVGLCLERRGVKNHELTVSNKIFDYHMAGLAVIASNLPGLRAVIERSHGGLLFEPGSPTDLAAKIVALYSNPPLRKECASNARAFALREGHRGAEMDKLVAAFRQVWRDRTPRSSPLGWSQRRWTPR